jgi:hypothetical protein
MRAGAKATALGCALDERASREPEAEQLGHLVERLAGGVVTRLADQPIVTRRTREIERGVAAGDDQRQERILRRIIRQERSVDVTLEVIHADERLAVHPRQRLRQRGSDEQRAHQPRSVGHRDPVDLGKPHTRLAERPLDDRHDDLDMTP